MGKAASRKEKRQEKKQAAKATERSAIMGSDNDTSGSTSTALETTVNDKPAIPGIGGSTASTSSTSSGTSGKTKASFKCLPLEIRQQIYRTSLPYQPTAWENNIHEEMQGYFDALADISTNNPSEISHTASNWYKDRLTMMIERLKKRKAVHVGDVDPDPIFIDAIISSGNQVLGFCEEPGRTKHLEEALKFFVYVIEKILGMTPTRNLRNFRNDYAAFIGKFKHATFLEMEKMGKDTNEYKFVKF